MKSKGLGRGGFNNLPDVEAHPQREQLEFIDQRDVYAAINVVEQRGQLSWSGRSCPHHTVENGAVESCGQIGSLRIEASYDFGDVAPRHSLIARILALGGKGDEKLLAGRTFAARGFQSLFVAFFEDGNHHFFSGSGIRGAFEDDQMSGPQMRRNRLRRVGDIAEMAFVILMHWRMGTDDNGIDLSEPGVVRGSC